MVEEKKQQCHERREKSVYTHTHTHNVQMKYTDIETLFDV